MPKTTTAGTPYLTPSDTVDQLPAVSQTIALAYDTQAASIAARVKAAEDKVNASSATATCRMLYKPTQQTVGTSLVRMTWVADSNAGDRGDATGITLDATGLVTVTIAGVYDVSCVFTASNGIMAGIRVNGKVLQRSYHGDPHSANVHLRQVAVMAAGQTIDVVAKQYSTSQSLWPSAGTGTVMETTDLSGGFASNNNRTVFLVTRIGG